MSTFIMFGKYSIEAVKEISALRTAKANAVIEDLGGEIKGGYALLGETDILVIVNLPGVNEAMQASVELTKLLGIAFTTSPAVTVEEFDQLIESRSAESGERSAKVVTVG
jgi:uncharacterized protein with GYD domain